jgi:hypothetical protein
MIKIKTFIIFHLILLYFSNLTYIISENNSNYFEKFFTIFIEECKNDIIIPCHYIIKKLPTNLIFNLIKKGTVIFTG